jgi:hypothetical protein
MRARFWMSALLSVGAGACCAARGSAGEPAARSFEAPLRVVAAAAPEAKAPAPAAWEAQISKDEIRGIIGFLASDLLEGRAPGTRGGDLAEAYVKSLYEQWGFAPYAKEGYFQPVPLTGVTTEKMTIAAGRERLEREKDLMGVYTGPAGDFAVEGDAVFVGYGIATDLWKWDDFKGVDVKGKIVIARVGEPASDDPAFFEGRALTYFGRWTYHIEEALRRGAKGVLLIHTDASAGYGWNVVMSSFGVEKLFLAEQIANDLAVRAWVKQASLERLLAAKGVDLPKLLAASEKPDFQPVDLGVRLRVAGRTAVRAVAANNVVARIPGKRDEAIVLSAHIDHLGKNDALAGDGIFNGAVDNGAAVAAMLLTAKSLARHRDELEYSVVVLAAEAEEAGLLGTKRFVALAPKGSVVADVNFESTPVWGEAKSLMGIGAEYSGFEALLREAAADAGLGYTTSSLSEQGFYYRSDQFPFAQTGIPAVWVSAGEDEASGERHYPAFWKGAYHTVDDEVDPAWELGATVQTVRAAVAVIRKINEAKTPPTWTRPLPFPVER